MEPRPHVVLTYHATRTHTVSAILTSTPSTHPHHTSSCIRALMPIGSLASCVRERAYMLALPSHKRLHPHTASPSPPSPLQAVSPTLSHLWTLALSPSSHCLAHPGTRAPSPTLALTLTLFRPSCHLAHWHACHRWHTLTHSLSPARTPCPHFHMHAPHALSHM